MSLVIDMIRGAYPILGNRADRDCVIVGSSFGTSTHDESVTRRLVDTALEYSDSIPWMADAVTVEAVHDDERRPEYIVAASRPGQSSEADSEHISNLLGQGVGTIGVLRACKKYMDSNELHSPLLLGQSHMMSRMIRQAISVGLDPITISGMPRSFDTTATRRQVYTRYYASFVAREVVGISILRCQKRL